MKIKQRTKAGTNMADQTKAGESESWRFYLPSLPVLETWLLQHRPFLYLATDLNNRQEIQLNQKSETDKYGSLHCTRGK